MARYEGDYHRRSYRGFSMRPEPVRGDSPDPNYRGGEYRGMRAGEGYGDHADYGDQAEYGRYRRDHARELGGQGGYGGISHREWRRLPDTGTYEPMRGYDRQGFGPPHGARGYDRGQRVVEDGGVRGDNRYLRDFNSESPALRHGGAYDRSYGHAEGAPGGRPGRGSYDRDHFQRDANRYGGYGSGGFGERWLPKHHP